MHSSKGAGVALPATSDNAFITASSFGLDNAFATFVKLFRSFLFDLSASLRLLKAAGRVLDTTSRVVFDGGGVSDLPTSAACACDIDGGGADDKRGNIEALRAIAVRNYSSSDSNNSSLDIPRSLEIEAQRE